jgi:hypothetical protein
VASVLHPSPIHLGLDVHKDTISVGSCRLISRSLTSSGSPTTSHRSAGSLVALAIPGCYKPATRPAPQGSNWPGRCTEWRWAAR